MPVIEVDSVRKRYPDADVPVLDGVNLTVDAGEVCALLGRNGAGKTTTIRILSTLLRYDDGAVTVAGFDVRRQAADVRRSIGLIGQHAALDDRLSGRSNLRLIGRLAGLDRAAARRRADDLLDRLELVDAADRVVGRYSGGMRRRLDLAAGLMVSPPVLLVDEPTTGLDPEARLAVWQTIGRLAEEGTTVLLTTQYLEEADRLADRIVMLRDGVVAAEGTPGDLKARVGAGWVEVTFADRSDRHRAQHLLESGRSVVTADDRLRIAVSRSAETTEVCALLDRHDLVPDDLTVGRPTLDDVFLHLHADGPHPAAAIGGSR